VLTKAWTTKTDVLKAIIKANGGNDFKLPHGEDMDYFDWEEVLQQWEDGNTDSEEDASAEEEESAEEKDEDEEDESGEDEEDESAEDEEDDSAEDEEDESAEEGESSDE
jgi:hypothetical protein